MCLTFVYAKMTGLVKKCHGDFVGKMKNTINLAQKCWATVPRQIIQTNTALFDLMRQFVCFACLNWLQYLL